MENKSFLILLSVALIVLGPGLISAAPLTEAHVTKIVNEVKLVDPGAGDRDAKLNDVVRDEIALTTGIKSRSELTFQDNTLTRLGPESYFSFKGGTREMTLQKGTMLLQVPKGLGGAKIHTASVTAAITGTTIMMEYVPQKALKFLVLEGTMRLSMNGRFGDSLLLTPGKMVIMPPNARRIPDPVTIDLKKVVQTSTLVNMHAKKGKQTETNDSSLPSISKIEKEIDQQQSGKDAHRLLDTNLVILGKGTNVVIGSDDLFQDLAERTDIAKANSVSAPLPVPATTPGPTPNPAPTPNSNPPPSGTPPPPPAVVYTTDNTTTINTDNNVAPTIVTQGVTTSGVTYKDLATNGSPAGFLFGAASAFDNKLDFDNFYLQYFKPSAVFVFDSLKLGGGITFHVNGEFNDIAIIGDNGITNSAATVSLAGANDVLFATMAGSIVLDNTISFGTSSDKPNLVQFYARGGDVNIGSTFTLDKTDLRFAAENHAIFSSNALLTSKSLTITGLQSVQFDGTANVSSTFQLNGGSIGVDGSVTAQDSFLFGTAATIDGTMGGDDLTANVNGNFLLSATGLLTNTGKVQITAGGLAQFDGTINAPSADFTVSGIAALPNTPGVLVNGNLTAKSFDFEPTGDFLLNASGSVNSTGNLKINTTNGAITLNGGLAVNDTTLTALNDVAVNHAITTHNLTINGQDETIAAAVTANDVNVNANGDVVVTAAGSFNSAGHHVAVTAGGNIDIAGSVTANDADFSPTGTFDLQNTGSFNLTGHLNIQTAQSITLAGSVNAHDVNLQAGTLTLNGSTTASKITLQLSVALNPGAPGSLIAAPTLSITVPTAFTFNTTDSSFTRFDPTNLSSLTIHAPTIVLPDNVTAANSVTLNTSSLAPQVTNTLSINAPNIAFQAAMTMNGQNGTPVIPPGNAFNLTLTTNDFNLNTALSLNGGDGDISVTDVGGNGGQLNITGHNITLNAPLNATTGQNSNNSLTGGNGGTVNLTASNTINLKNKIEVSSNDGNRRRSAKGGNINVTSSATSGTAISISNSAQLLALLNAAAPGPGGSIKFISAGGAINMNGAAQADRGSIEITNNGTTTGNITLNNATLAADTIKVGALAPNGTLNVGGGSISADTLLKLYAGGSNGTIDFVDNVTLGGNSAKIIAANTVIINNGKIVTILGPAAADVFTNHPHYTGFGGDNTTTGTFAGKGAVTHPLSGAPGY